MKDDLEVIAVVGPTASGKTALSIALAKMVDGEIINGDSTQVYKGFSIGTAKITREEMDGVPHHLFDTLEPTTTYSVAEYQHAVRTCIEDIRSRGKMPIIVGGTGLYVQAVLFDFRFTEEAGDERVRARLEEELETEGADVLYERLVKLDPVSAEKIHPNNHRRLIRALEIIEVTGKTKDAHEQNKGHEEMYRHLIIGLEMDREKLYDCINRRTTLMMEEGFLQEVEQLLEAGYAETQPMGAIGYRELKQYIEGTLSYEMAVEGIRKSTRNYAKRQMTYFKNKMAIHWVQMEKGIPAILEEISTVIKGFSKK